MEKQMLRCDICGGELEMQGGGKAVCTSCGMKYSTESLREKFNGLKVSVTGSREDVEQWRSLLRTYLSTFDYEAAAGVVKKILEAIPSDSEANNIYTKMQSWKYFDIRNGCVIEYNGSEEVVFIPDGIREIRKEAFVNYKGENPLGRIKHIRIPNGIKMIADGTFSDILTLCEVDLPETIESIGAEAFKNCKSLKQIELPDSVKAIGEGAFEGCETIEDFNLPDELISLPSRCFQGCISLKSIRLPSGIMKIGEWAFSHCSQLKEIVLPEALTELGKYAFSGTGLATVRLPESLQRISDGCFGGCSNLKYVHLCEDKQKKRFIEGECPFGGCPVLYNGRVNAAITTSNPNYTRILHFSSWGDAGENSIYIEVISEQTLEWRKTGLCEYCGGAFEERETLYMSGFRPRKCKQILCINCGRRKLYW